MRNTSLIAALAASTCIVATATPAHAQQTSFNIPAGSLNTALDAYGRQSGRPIVYKADEIRGARSSGYRGNGSPEQALDAVLAGTGFSARAGASGAVAIVKLGNGQSTGADSSPSPGETEDIVVTGTHLQGVKPVTPVQTFTTQEMQRRGYSTLAEMFQQLSQNAGGGASMAGNSGTGTDVGPDLVPNTNFATGVNLRGLGPSATLTLLNGHRLPTTAQGLLTDISGLPLSAIDHVDVLTDGASAIYGSDAVAGVVNIVTKKRYNGIETGVRMANVAEGKDLDYAAYALAGKDWGSGGVLFDIDYVNSKPLLASKRAFTDTALDPTYLFPASQTYSLLASIHQDIGDKITLSSDTLYSNRAYSSDTNLGYAVLPVSGRTKEFSTSAEIDFRPNASWKFSLIGQIGEYRDRSEYSYMGSVNSNELIARKESTKSLEAQANGKLFALPGGDVSVALGASALYDGMYDGATFCSPTCTTYTAPLNARRTVYSGYAEALFPLIGPGNNIPLVNELRFDAAVRYDHYSDFGSTTNPKFAMQWNPVADLSVHASFSKSFKAPTLCQLDCSPGEYAILYYANGVDLSQGNALFIEGQSNPNLKPETATTYNIGAEFKPRSAPGLSFQVSYFRINYRNKIQSLVGNFLGKSVLNGELGQFLTLNPTPAQIADALASANLGLYCYDSDCSPNDATAIANVGLENTATVQLRGWDFGGTYKFTTRFGDFALNAAGTYIATDNQRITPQSVAIAYAGVAYVQPRFRGSVNLGWTDGGWAANGRINYLSPEKNLFDTSCSGTPCSVKSWTTFDFSGSYAFPGPNWMHGTRLSVSVANVFNAKPPFLRASVLSGINYDTANTNPLGRALTVSIVRSW